MPPTAEQPLHVLFTTPCYWPAVAYGGPTWKVRELAEGLERRGHAIDVYTSSIVDLTTRPAWQTSERRVGGVRVRYLATPFRFRWTPFTPTVVAWLRRNRPPDVGHVFGYRDAIGTAAAVWLRRRGVPYVFEPLGMFAPKLRRLALKRGFDALLARRVAEGAAAIIATSEFEREELVAAGLAGNRIHVRPNGFPEPVSIQRNGELRARVGIPRSSPLVLYVGRVAAGKGLPLLLDVLRDLPDVHLAVAGPDGGDGTWGTLAEAARAEPWRDRVHLLGSFEPDGRLALYSEADVFVLPSSYESFGNAAAEASAVGVPAVVTDRCGVAELVRDRAGLVVPYQREALAEAVGRLLGDPALRSRLGAGGRRLAAELSWTNVCERQETIYREVLTGD